MSARTTRGSSTGANFSYFAKSREGRERESISTHDHRRRNGGHSYRRRPCRSGRRRGTPVNRYDCTSGYYIKIKPRHHYKFSVGKGGKFAYKPANQKIVFKTGYLHKDWYGGFRRDANTHDPIVDIYLKDGSGSDTCYV